MRPVNLAEVVARAELLRLRWLLRRQGGRVALVAVAAVFLLAALAGAHAAAIIALMTRVAPVWAVLIVAAADLVIAAGLLAAAAPDRPGPVEREARAVSLDAQRQLTETLTVGALLGTLLRLFGGRDSGIGGTLAALLTGWLRGRR